MSYPQDHFAINLEPGT